MEREQGDITIARARVDHDKKLSADDLATKELEIELIKETLYLEKSSL